MYFSLQIFRWTLLFVKFISPNCTFLQIAFRQNVHGPLSLYLISTFPKDQCTSKTYYSRIHKSQSIAFEDKLILVDSMDRKIGEATKEECHKLIDGRVPLHRAFSLFVFDSHDRLYMQKRSKFKHTFANTWSMTCCSHPLADYHPSNHYFLFSICLCSFFIWRIMK